MAGAIHVMYHNVVIILQINKEKKKTLPANAGDVRDSGSIPGWGISSGEERATHSCILAWESPWTEEPGGLHSTGSQRAGLSI